MLIKGLTGKYGNLVFRQVKGRTVIAKAPSAYPPPTEIQKSRQSLFRNTTAYARQLLADPVVKEAYQAKAKPRQSAFNVAIAEYMRQFGGQG